MFMSRKCAQFGLLMYMCICIFLLSSSCISSKSITYFNNLPDSIRTQLDTLQPPQPIIQVNDLLQIKIGGESEKTVEYINKHFIGDGGGGGLQTMVDLEGNIELPQIGKLKVSGLTKEAAKDSIKNAYKEYLVDPIVAIKFGDFRYTLLGEVSGQGNKTATAEKVSILEAIAQGGGLTQYAQFDKVKIFREVNGKREIIAVNLNDKNLLNSPNFYLHPNDVVYVQPKEVKQLTENFQRTLFYISGVTSILTIFLVLFKK